MSNNNNGRYHATAPDAYQSPTLTFDDSSKAFGENKEQLYDRLSFIGKPQALRNAFKDQRLSENVDEKTMKLIEAFLESCTIKPMVNQVELHPLLQLRQLHDYCTTKEIKLEAWAPIMRGKVQRIVLLKNIGSRYGKTPVQVALRWAIQRGIIVIPKSENPVRIESNADIRLCVIR